ncbi:MAG: hypothetical protein V4726_13165 [Verrucomicrobiota bacterium]
MKKRHLGKLPCRALWASLLAAKSSALAVTAVPGTLINVDFNGDAAGVGGLPQPRTFAGDLTDPITAASVAFEDSTPADDLWNGSEESNSHSALAGQPQPLTDSLGNATDVTVTWTGFTFNYSNYNNGRSGNGRTNGPNGDGYYCGAADPPASVTIGGLDPAKTYNVVTLAAGDSVKFTIGTDTRSIATWNSTTNASNWAVYQNITPSAAGNIVITVASNGGNYGMAGLQIVPTPAVGDTDNDGMPDAYEDAHGLSKNDASDAAKDADQDESSNYQEYRKGTDPQKEDTDGDGLKDGAETGNGAWTDALHTGTDPLKADTDGDGLRDGDENPTAVGGSDPNKRDTDNDEDSDGVEIEAGTNPKDPASKSNQFMVVTPPLINVDFNGSVAGVGGLPSPVTFDGFFKDLTTLASVAYVDATPAVGDKWNGWEVASPHTTLANQPQTLVDSHGGPTAVTVKWSGFTFNYTNYSNGRFGNLRTNGPNADGYYCGAADPPATVTLGGMDPAKTYNVVALGAGDPVSFTIRNDTRAIAAWNSNDNPSNWAVYTDLIPSASGEITITVSSNGGNYGIAGLQLYASGTVVDTDRDSIPDNYENAHGMDKNDASDAAGDPDKDGLSSLQEYQNSTDPQKKDTDGDGLSDAVENRGGVWVDALHTGTDPLKADTDGDGLSDGVETHSGNWTDILHTGTNPLKVDTDGDGLKDGDENPVAVDGSDPNKNDTDGDGDPDGVELAVPTNPRDPSSKTNQFSVVTGSLINVDFNGSAGGRGGLPSPVTFDGNFKDLTTLASVAYVDANPAVQDKWNGWEVASPHTALANQPQPLVDSRSVATGVTVKWSGFTFNYTNYVNGKDGNLRTNGPNADGYYCGAADPPATVTLGGLNPTNAYSLVTLGAGDPVNFTVGQDTRAIGGWNSNDNASNWAVYTGLVPSASGEIVIGVSSNGGNYGIAGLQLAISASAPAATFRILSVTRNPATGAITLSWESTTGKTYGVYWSADMSSFATAVTGQTNLPGVAGSMTATFPVPAAGAPRLFFQVKSQ